MLSPPLCGVFMGVTPTCDTHQAQGPQNSRRTLPTQRPAHPSGIQPHSGIGMGSPPPAVQPSRLPPHPRPPVGCWSLSPLSLTLIWGQDRTVGDAIPGSRNEEEEDARITPIKGRGSPRRVGGRSAGASPVAEVEPEVTRASFIRPGPGCLGVLSFHPVPLQEDFPKAPFPGHGSRCSSSPSCSDGIPAAGTASGHGQASLPLPQEGKRLLIPAWIPP